MTYTPKLSVRPWVNGTLARRLGSRGTLHYDLHAIQDTAQRYWFVIEARQAGRRLFARSVFHWNGTQLLEAAPTIDAFRRLQWTAETNEIFRAVHPALLAQCVHFPGYVIRSILCHYVPVPDSEPFPEDMRNSWNYGRESGANTKRTPKPRPIGAAVKHASNG